MPNFRGNEDWGKFGKEYLNDLLCKFGPFCLQHSKTFDILHTFLRVTIAELLTLKQVRVFWLKMRHPEWIPDGQKLLSPLDTICKPPMLNHSQQWTPSRQMQNGILNNIENDAIIT